MNEEEVGVVVHAIVGALAVPVAVGHIHRPLCAVFLIGFYLVGGVSLLGGEHVDAFEEFSHGGSFLGENGGRHEAGEGESEDVFVVHVMVWYVFC